MVGRKCELGRCEVVVAATNLYPGLDVGEVVGGGEDGLPLALLGQLAVRLAAHRERRRVHEPLWGSQPSLHSQPSFISLMWFLLLAIIAYLRFYAGEITERRKEQRSYQ